MACLGTKRIICQSSSGGTGCFDSLSACPQDQWRTNIFTQCSAVATPTNNIIRSIDQQCQKNILMNVTTGQNPNQIYNLTVSLNGDQFCSVALVNNLDQDVIFRMGPNNNSTVSERLLDSDFLVDFTNN